uniref:D-xylose 1-dehydrogenase (NADP(+), D-xylono-1,5-lactone-forming) n=1 Tax=Pseudo-nitzschia delicatissima TaxID=44447 RepID=A0A7S0YBF2_9STRA|mmetsp:Transcript_2367/g.4992  ORF Transcript_2367/g.4992 Transcript_2367/m.4992 type:complete len:403 (+) Transcript_2367:54-1262(+)
MQFSIPPPPLDDPSVLDPLECPPLKWGILGCGRVSNDFCQALKHLPTQTVVACSARSSESAEAFSKKHAIKKYCGSYDEMLQDSEVEIVYVGNVHSFRRSTGEKCLLAGKHVVLEKPFACSVDDANYLISLAKEKDLFIMEGMWTRFFPAVQKARDLALGNESVLGEIASVFSDFNFNAADSEEYPSSFVYQRKLGGGANLLVGPYPIAAATLFFDGRMPEYTKALGQVDEETGVELQSAVVLSFSPTGTEKPLMGNGSDSDSRIIYPKLPGSGVATLSYGFLCETLEETTVVGSKGRMKIESPGHCPTNLTVELKAEGRGQLGKKLSFEYALPSDTEEIIASGGYFYPNSAGFCYEAAAVARCIASGKREAPQFTLEETMLNLKIIEEIRTQLGVKAVDED